MGKLLVLGIDLAASPKQPTGVCLLSNSTAKTSLAFTDSDILAAASENPRLVSIDAPLSLPEGRCCLKSDCGCRTGGHLRKCDREVRALGIKILPLTLGSMRALTSRGIMIKTEFQKREIQVIESFPGGAKSIWGIARKDVAELRRVLVGFGLSGDINRRNLSEHELDAIICAMVGKLYVENKFYAAGVPEEGQIILPKISTQTLK